MHGFNSSSPWYHRWRNPHPVPNRDEPHAHSETPRERQQRERETNNKLRRLQGRYNALIVQAARARTRMNNLLGNVEAHARAAVKFVNLLNDQHNIRDQIAKLATEQEAA